MDRRDKINALWLTVEMALNVLEDMGEEINTTAAGRIVGTSARVSWSVDRERWEAEKLT